jgi:hypothetical protein
MQQNKGESIPKQMKAKVPKGMTQFNCAGTHFICEEKYEYIK